MCNKVCPTQLHLFCMQYRIRILCVLSVHFYFVYFICTFISHISSLSLLPLAHFTIIFSLPIPFIFILFPSTVRWRAHPVADRSYFSPATTYSSTTPYSRICLLPFVPCGLAEGRERLQVRPLWQQPCAQSIWLSTLEALERDSHLSRDLIPPSSDDAI